jgi:hypothetical protein
MHFSALFAFSTQKLSLMNILIELLYGEWRGLLAHA